MVDPRELRIGNWVEDNASTWSEFNNMKSPWEKYQFQWTAKDFQNHQYRFNGIDPIPLTPEILEKCGFEEKYVITQDQDEINWMQLGELSIGDGGCQYDGAELSEPQYLHQLQNLYFCLTGSELTYTP